MVKTIKTKDLSSNWKGIALIDNEPGRVWQWDPDLFGRRLFSCSAGPFYKVYVVSGVFNKTPYFPLFGWKDKDC